MTALDPLRGTAGAPVGTCSHRILVRLPNWVGDLMMAVPAVDALRAGRPDAYLVGMAQPAHLELARRIVSLDEVTEAPSGTGISRAVSIWTVVRKLRRQAPEAAALLAPSFESALTARLAGIPVRVGHSTDARGSLLTEVVPVVSNRHRSDDYLEVVSRLGANDDQPQGLLALSAEDRQWGARFVAGFGWPADAQLIFVNPAAAKTPRAWSADRFCRLVEAYADRDARPYLLVHEHPPFQAPTAWTTRPEIGVVAGVTLVQLAAILGRCALYVGNDSGPMHLAAALGVPTVGIYGSSIPRLTSPCRGPAPHVAVSASLPCAPCRERFFTECPSLPTADGRPPCLDQVTVEMVATAVDRLLSTPGTFTTNR